jgi:hypothetical protein
MKEPDPASRISPARGDCRRATFEFASNSAASKDETGPVRRGRRCSLRDDVY